MTVSKKQQACVRRYKDSNYDRVELLVPKGNKDKIKAYASSQGLSVNALVNALLDNAMQGFNYIPGSPEDTSP